MSDHVELAGPLLKPTGAKIELGDGSDMDVGDATHVYLTWISLSDESRRRLEKHLLRNNERRRIIAVDRPPSDDAFVCLSQHRCLYPWGFRPVWVGRPIG